MSIDSDSLSEEKSIFRPFTRESLKAIEQRIADEHARQKELELKRAAGLVSNYLFLFYHSTYSFRDLECLIRSQFYAKELVHSVPLHI